jgi:hypothetical protein
MNENEFLEFSEANKYANQHNCSKIATIDICLFSAHILFSLRLYKKKEL